LGDCYVDTGDPDRAIEYYDRALKANPTFQGHVLQGLGVAYRRKGEPDRALEYFENAFKAEGGDKGSILNNLGATHYEKENFDRAIEYWNQAIAEGTYKHPWVALHNLGVGYSAKGELEPALEFYKEAKASAAGRDVAILEETLNNMALIYAARGEVDLALETLEEVLAQPDRNQQHERAKNIRTQVLAQKAKIKPSREDESLVAATTTSGSASETPESRMKQKLLGKEDKYSDYLKKENSKRENTFSVLRGWSSAVTLLEGGTLKQWRGGGYFLKWGGRGLVLDPGFDFIDNFHDAGFHTREVDAVVVSHNHPDHNFDLTSLDDLRFEIFRRDLKALPDKTTVPALPPTLFAIDEDTAVVFKDDSPKHRGRPVRFSGSDYERKRWLDRENGLPFRIEHFPVQHGKDVPNAVGIRLVLYDPKGGKDFVIGYTGDTKYFADEGAPTLADQLRGCHLLLAHISQPMTQEFDDPTFPKPIHLGYNGVANLVNEVKPRLTLIGEFWAGLADLRLDLIQGLRRRCATDAILPTGLGFHLSVPSLEVECTRCRAPVAFPQIKVAPPTTPFGPLGYLCPKCLV
jgi:tetratricopeptide (TPR) repeat protein